MVKSQNPGFGDLPKEEDLDCHHAEKHIDGKGV